MARGTARQLKLMDKQRWGHVKELFVAAIELPANERDAFLLRCCGPDPALQHEVRRLLERHFQAEPAFLDGMPCTVSDLDLDILTTARCFALNDVVAGRFRIDGLLGHGGMGEVYRAYDLELDDYVALKTIRSIRTDPAKAIARFKAEATRARRITSRYVCRVNDLFVHEAKSVKLPLLSMELLEGETLAQHIRRKGLFSKDTALPLIEQLCEGLYAAHSNGIIHGDLKSNNVMLVRGRDGDRRAVLLDFGLAQISDHPPAAATTRASMGTPAYMAPEQHSGAPASFATDIYSLGLIIVEILTGALPTRSENGIVCASPLERASAALAAVSNSPAWNRAILGCLAENPDARYRSPQELAKALRVSTQPAISRRALMQTSAAAGIMALTGYSWFSTGGLGTPVLAVVPFNTKPISGSTDYSWFGDGFSEGLIDLLSRNQSLSVIARDSSFRYRGNDGRKALKELGASYLVTGEMERAAGELSIDVRLIGVNGVLWSERFTVSNSQVRDAQDRVASGIAQRLRLPANTQLAGYGFTRNPAANDKYYMGRFHWGRRSDESLLLSVQYFEEAVQLDPAFAIAYAGLADAYSVLAERALIPPVEVLPKAKQAALRSVEIEGALANAHVSLAQVSSLWDRDYLAADREFQRALALDSRLVLGHQWYSYMLVKQRRFDASIQAGMRAVELDPLSVPANSNLAVVFQYVRDDKRMVAQCRRLLELDPMNGFAHSLIALALAREGKSHEALAEFQANTRSPDHPHRLRSWCELNVLLGKKIVAMNAARRLVEKKLQKESVPSSYIAMAFSALGEADQSFHWLQNAVKEYDAFVSLLQAHPAYDAIRDDPRYASMLFQIGLAS